LAQGKTTGCGDRPVHEGRKAMVVAPGEFFDEELTNGLVYNINRHKKTEFEQVGI
jgi:hypothetical protein